MTDTSDRRVQVGQLSINMKDVSDWAKVIVLLGSLIAGYVHLSDQVADHTNKLSDIQTQVGTMRNENKTRNYDMQRKVGAISMYLCSKDPSHCTPDAPTQDSQ